MFEDNLKKRLNKREQRQKLHLVQSELSKDVDTDSNIQTANNTNIHFQSHNNIRSRNFMGTQYCLKYLVVNNFQ